MCSRFFVRFFVQGFHKATIFGGIFDSKNSSLMYKFIVGAGPRAGLRYEAKGSFYRQVVFALQKNTYHETFLFVKKGKFQKNHDDAISRVFRNLL